MIEIIAQATDTVTTTTTGIAYGVNVPMAVALLFGLAGAFFVGIYILRRRRNKSDD